MCVCIYIYTYMYILVYEYAGAPMLPQEKEDGNKGTILIVTVCDGEHQKPLRQQVGSSHPSIPQGYTQQLSITYSGAV